MQASYLFDYKNQVEVKAVFIPLLKTTHNLNNIEENGPWKTEINQLNQGRTATLPEDIYA